MNKYIFLNDEIKLTFNGCCSIINALLADGTLTAAMADEIMADFIGMYEAFGFYKAEWFLRFMGIIEGSGGRMPFYTKDLSANVKKAVSDIVSEAAYNLEEWSKTDSFVKMSYSERIKFLCRMGLIGMISMKRQQ